MSERLSHQPERKLWYEGANYTADAVVVSPDFRKVLLIQRADTGEWALPGGFVEGNISPSGVVGRTRQASYRTAIREVMEETGIPLDDLRDSELLYRGKVVDPRNTDTAWIETNAYIFIPNEQREPQAGDDAQAAQWRNLNDLPSLYGSHQNIIYVGLDYLNDWSYWKPAWRLENYCY